MGKTLREVVYDIGGGYALVSSSRRRRSAGRQAAVSQ